MNVVNNLEFDWNKIMEAAAGFLKNGAGSVLETTINTAKNIIGAVGTFFYCICIRSLYFAAERETGKTGEKKYYLRLSGRGEQKLYWKCWL